MSQCSSRPMLGLLLLVLPFGSRAGLPLELQAGIRASTFEVVLKKPTADPLSYEKALPFDLLPFVERNDQYRSIGTAFALGQNRYVSAAHVFALAINSQFGAPALRGANGEVYPVDRILKFSSHGDFVVFSLSRDPAPAGLPINRAPKIDTAVFAVGNALGEGVVIREGAFTSETPEEQDGLWKWIRFSAAASPGNSGGPLLDEAGNVVGIVLRKSANENLNYSLPIGILLDAPGDKAVYDERELTSLPFMRGTHTYAYRDEFHLPLAWPEFVKAHAALITRHFDESGAELTKAYADTAFSRGVGVDAILYSKGTNFYDPRLIVQQNDDTWNFETADCCTSDLPDDGIISVGWVRGVALLRLHRSKYASDDAFYADSKAFMDIALKGLSLTRQVGRDEIRITSLGSAQSEIKYTDHFGRIWQQRVWVMPFRDAYVVGFLLPTPEGYSGMIQIAPSLALPETESILRRMADQFSVSYAGNPAQWQAFLKRSAFLPKALSGVTLTQNPDWELRTSRFETRILAKNFPMSDQGQVGLITGYIHDGTQFVWDVVGALWAKDAEQKSSVGLLRLARPPKSAKLELRSAYADVAARRPPFDGQLQHDTADAFGMSEILDVPGREKGKASSDLLYAVTARLEGRNAYEDISELLSLVSAGTRILEHGVGEDVDAHREAPLKAESGPPEAYSSADYAVLANGLYDNSFGLDTRGRHMSDDFKEYVLTGKKGSSSSPSDAAQSNKRADALLDYWRLVPGLIHNRDLWSAFLERNNLPSTTPHRYTVIEAQTKLAVVLDAGDPRPEWTQLAQAAIDSYVKERVDFARSHTGTLPAMYSPRKGPCPKAAEKRSDGETPTLAPLTRSPDEFFPNEARRAQIEGSVVVAVQVDSSGCGKQRGVVTSSGSADIDQAALEFVDTAEFFPGQRGGTAVDGIFKTIVHFKMK